MPQMLRGSGAGKSPWRSRPRSCDWLGWRRSGEQRAWSAAGARGRRGAGVVCSGREARAVKARYGASLQLLIPGIRLAGGATHDQSRTASPAEAVAAGADYVIVGRAVTAAPNRVAAMREILSQLR